MDGVYLDGTVWTVPCQNTLHGCGYVGPDGAVRSTYPVFATRQFMKRLYTAIKTRKPDGIVDVHLADCLNVPALSFATSYWAGENLLGSDFILDSLPLDRFRTEFMGHNIGIPADLLYYVLGNYDACTGVALLHDVPVRSENEKDLKILSDIWRVRESFGCGDAKFMGYWKDAEFVSVSPEGCYASLWKHPRNGVLVIVSNLTRAPAEIMVTLRPKALGLGSKMSAEEARTGKPIPIQDNRFSLHTPSQGWQLIWIRPGV
jgi:hypothetical protein